MLNRLLVLCALFVFCLPAHAYLDPGTGSALIQGIIAAIAALGVTLKLYWHRIKAFLSVKKGQVEKSTPDSE